MIAGGYRLWRRGLVLDTLRGEVVRLRGVVYRRMLTGCAWRDGEEFVKSQVARLAAFPTCDIKGQSQIRDVVTE